MARTVVVVAAVVAAIACAAAQAAPVWTDIIEGGAIPDPWYFFSPLSGNTQDTVIIDAGTLNRALVLIDNSSDEVSGKAQVIRPNWADGPNGVTVHCRFMVVSGSADGAIGIQIPDGYTGGDQNGHVKWGWHTAGGGQMQLDKGTADAGQPTSFSAPADTWVEMWETISNWRWKLWLKSGENWTLYSQGALRSGGAAPYIGSGSFPATNTQMQIDFARLYILGAYEPTDPNRPVLPAATNRIGEAKVSYCLGYPVDFPNKIVTNSWVVWSDPYYFNYLYIQDDDRSAGVRVRRLADNDSDKIPVGSRINVKGYFDAAQHDLFAAADSLTTAAPAPDPVVLPKSLGMTSLRVGGGRLGAQHAASDLSVGLNNVGLRVRTFGIVQASGYNDPLTGFAMAYIDDGGGLYNDAEVWFGQDVPGIKVYTADPLMFGDKAEVTGNAAVEEHPLYPGQHYPVIYANQPGDVRTY